MRPGLRLQLLVLLGALLLFSFVPLYLAVSTYTKVALQQIRVGHARALGRAVAAQVSEAHTRRPPSELVSLLRAEVGSAGVETISIHDHTGAILVRAGENPRQELGSRLDVTREATFEMEGAHGRALAVVVPSGSGAVVAILRIDDDAAHAAPLLRLLGMYTLLVAFSLLGLSYFALTYLIVRPLDELGRAAERVARGARRLKLPPLRSRELAELGGSVASMTERLISEEEALRKKIDEVEAATRRLTEAQDRLVRSERLASVGRLAAGLAHEIGNPISALMGLEDLLLAGGLDPGEERDFLVRMRRETERIHRILRDLLQFARPAANSPTEPPAPGDVNQAVHDTVTLVAPQKDMKEIEIRLELEDDLPRVTLGNEHLVQVVLNLLLNAADAVGAGGHIVVSARRHDARVELSVTDDGPGVSSELRPRLFEPFATTKDPGKGTGLGLAVCRGLVEAAGGSVTLDETRPKGARFVVELPVAGAELLGNSQ
ncbi:MAG: sensor histidine kinase [Myxococcota bacterium]